MHLLLLLIIAAVTQGYFENFKISPRTMSLTCLQNDLIIRAARGERVERTPVWLFRQAGRHLPEYNAYKASKRKNFLQLLEDPLDVTEITMQPVRRYNVDAAILFSDILVLLQAMNIEVTMPGGRGITVPNPITSVEDYRDRVLGASVDVHSKLPHIFEAIRLIKGELHGRIPLIGFSAAPWTLLFYLLGGSSKSNQQVPSSWLKKHPVESRQLLDMLTRLVVVYLSAQVEAGVDLLQVFEAMGEHLDREDFHAWALPCMAQIAQELKRRHPAVPLMVFPRGASYSLEALQAVGYDVVTLDTQTDRHTIRARLQQAAAKVVANGNAGGVGDLAAPSRSACIQGNFDVRLLSNLAPTLPPTYSSYSSSSSSSDKVPAPAQLDTANKGETTCFINTNTNIDVNVNTPESVRREVARMLRELGGPQLLIANLGEGLTGSEDPALVAAFVDAVHTLSEEVIGGA